MPVNGTTSREIVEKLVQGRRLINVAGRVEVVNK